jgi:hypothetical protein
MRLFYCLAAFAALAAPAVGEPNEPLEAEARELVQQFIGRLKPQLKQAMGAGGPTHAIEVCASEAPKIADSLSAQSGWFVKRVSLKARNASRALPDDWERTVLERFDQRQAAGEKASDIHFGERTGSTYRYMQAQAAEGLCLVCHGESLAPPVADVLDQYYPDDRARGYEMGQVRGAISVAREL